MDNRIKDTVKIQILNMVFFTYITENNSRYIGEEIRMHFKANTDLEPTTLIDKKNKEVKGYYIGDVSKNLNTKSLIFFARVGLNKVVEDELSNPTKPKELGDFDRLIKQALDYNPKEKEK